MPPYLTLFLRNHGGIPEMRGFLTLSTGIQVPMRLCREQASWVVKFTTSPSRFRHAKLFGGGEILIAKEIDRHAEQRPGLEVLSLACGHLREIEISSAAAHGKIARLVAADQDQKSLSVIYAYPTPFSGFYYNKKSKRS